MNRCNVLVVVVDSLRASALGAYGNTIFATPALDEFAAGSFLLDFCFAPAVELRDIYRSLWHGIHPLRPNTAEESSQSLSRHFSQSGYRTTLVTDERQLQSFAAVQHFDQCVDVGSSLDWHGLQSRADDASQTALARLFATTCELIESNLHSADAPRLVWLHSRGMSGPWDAPVDFQQALLDEGDPPPLDTFASPDVVFTADDDPDLVFRYSCGYAAQIMVVDACWRGLMETISARLPRETWLVVLLGARGFPLGEHQRIGGVDPRLYGEQLHVPFLISFPDNIEKLTRSAALVSHTDLFPTLAACVGGVELAPAHNDGLSLMRLLSNGDGTWRDALLSTSASSKSLRTANWCLRHDDLVGHRENFSDGVAAGELYVRPDDRWEANDVAKLCPEVVETLVRVTADVSRQLSQNERVDAKVLPETLDVS